MGAVNLDLSYLSMEDTESDTAELSCPENFGALVMAADITETETECEKTPAPARTEKKRTPAPVPTKPVAAPTQAESTKKHGGMKHDIETIKERISCEEYARNVLRLDLRADGDGWRGRSFRTDAENPTSLRLSNGLWVDYGTGKGGDVIALCAEANHGGDTGAAIRELADLTGLKVDGGASTSYSTQRASFVKLIEHWHSLLTDDDREYLHKRKINDKTIDALLIGRGDNSCLTYGRHMGRLIVPYWRHGQPVYFISRSRPGAFKEEGKISAYSAKDGGFVASYDVGNKEAAREAWESFAGEHFQELEGAKYIKAFAGTKEKPNNELDHCVWGLDTLTRKSNAPLVIAEGMFDALSFWQEGYRVISPITGRFSKEQIPDVLSAARLAGRVCAVFDNDGRGADFRVHAAQMLFDAGIKFTTARVPEEYNGDEIKDISDYYERGGDISVFVDEPPRAYTEIIEKQTTIKMPDNPFDLQTGLVYIARCASVYGDVTAAMRDAGDIKAYSTPKGNASDKITHVTRADALAAVKKVMRTGSRFRYAEFSAYKYNLQDILLSLTNDSDEFNAVWKWLNSSPRDSEAAEWVKAKHDYMHLPDRGIYEYAGGVWTLTKTPVIKSAIQKELGRFVSSSLTNATSELLSNAPDIVRANVLLNRQEIMNFRNGVLELKTGKFTSHSPSFYSSVQAAYDYDEKATCPRWGRFIYEVTGGDLERAYCLQEMAGNVLCSDNRFAKAFYLIGGGSNGKTVFLDILTALFGGTDAGAVSHIDMSHFNEVFELIALDSSIMNISMEMNTSGVKQATVETDNFKKAVGGDPISACKKYQGFITFRTRAKLFFAANNFFKTTDISYGLERRLLFVSFPVTFAMDGGDAPTPDDIKDMTPEERAAAWSRPLKIDLGLTAALMAEMSGIFNWAYKGYKRLLQRGEFTESADHREVMAEFKRLSNPVYQFATEYTRKDKITKTALYTCYLNWRDDNGYKTPACSKSKFTRDVESAFKSMGVSFSECWIGKERAYQFKNED